MGGTAVRLAVVGIGKIARDQHLPAIAGEPAFVLTATASRHAGVDGVPQFSTIEDLLAHGPEVDAVSICTPPDGRHRIAAAALAAGKHVMIEKPPGATVAEVEGLRAQAAATNLTLYATWHSRAAAGVDGARHWLAARTVRSAAITWREDIRVWHPGQEWILGPGGFGVFDPGINALSIATAILPGHLTVASGCMTVPDGRASPIAASLALELDHAVPVAVDFDFLQTGPQSWDIDVVTDAGTLRLSDGGSRLFIDGVEQPVAGPGEYPRLYRRFAELVAAGVSDVDLRPLQLVADAFLIADRGTGPAFAF
ncbi:MAG: Gfo/Idh/MocA family oxidoreductase [Pseudomonadota bacterium]